MSGAEGYSRRQRIGLLGGPALFGLAMTAPPPGLAPAGAAVLACTLWIATWWITEAVPIPVTSLLPIVCFPLLDVASVADAAAPYADPVVFLFLGGFLVALAIERWGLHRRIALSILAVAGSQTRRLVFAFMVATAGLSMWISNTATAMVMLPIGMAVVAQLENLRSAGTDSQARLEDATDALRAGDRPTSNFGAALLLGIAYAASIGGVATIIGTPPNAILAGALRSSLGVELGFLEWMVVGLPLAAVFLVVAWVVVMRVLPPEVRELPGTPSVVAEQRAALGPMGAGERRVLAIFGLVAAGWLLRPFLITLVVPGVTDTTIALVGAVLVFVVPVDVRRGEFLLDWDAATRVPWGILLLIGAGFSLAHGVQSTGLDHWVAAGLAGLAGLDIVWAVLAVAVVTVILTEVASNTATASLLLPVMASLAVSLAVAPEILMVAAAAQASLSFMLPVATPPNAIVFASGYVTLPQMARVGIRLNLVAVVLVTLFVTLWVPVAWGL